MAGMVEGKVVVVTGAGGGIGRDIALAMAAEGAKVVVNDIGASITGEGTDAGPAQARGRRDQAPPAARRWPTPTAWPRRAAANRIVQRALDSFGRIDGVVNNAGILRDRFFHKMSEDEWDAVIKVHLYGSFYVSRAAANHFKEQDSGAFVHMTSHLGPDRQLRPGQLRGGQAGHRGAVEVASRSTCRSSTCAPTASRRSPGAA